MHRFLESRGIVGEVVPVGDNPLDADRAGASHYRATFRAGGKSFETRCSRATGAEAPSIGAVLAEVARRAVGAEGDGAPLAVLAARTAEAESLRSFLGEDGHRELLFEFGRRPAGDIERADQTSTSARSDEMTNQEPAARLRARRAGKRAARAWMVALAAVPTVGLAAGSWLYSRGRRRSGGLALAGGAASAVAAAVVGALLGRRGAQEAEQDELTSLAAERASIERGHA